MSIGKQIRKAREKLGWSQRELGEAVGVKEAMISHIENGIRSVSPRKAANFERALGIPRVKLCPEVFG